MSSTLDAPQGPPLIGALLRMPDDVVRRGMLEALLEHGFDDITPSHFGVFRYPGPRGERPSELAAQSGMTKQAMNYLLGQLEGLGYVERRPDPQDARSRCVHLTDRGTAVIGVVRARVLEIERAWAAELGGEDFEQLRRLLLRLNAVAATAPLGGPAEAMKR
jgi:DNA-binding MarR family transcriptional regulator